MKLFKNRILALHVSPWLWSVMGLISLTFLGIFLFYPLMAILWHSLRDTSQIIATLQNPYYWQRLIFTTGQALLSTLLTVVLALPGAVLFARYNFWAKGLIRSLLTIPFVMPTVVASMGFLSLFGARGVLDLRDSLWLILIAHVFYNYALVVRIVSAYLEAMGSRLEEASAVLGASSWRTFWRLILPLAWPAILAAATLVFIFCFTSFGIIVMLAPSPGLATLEVEIYRLTAKLLRLDTAAVLVLLQLAVIALLTWLYTHLQRSLAVPLSAYHSLRKPQGWWRIAVYAHLLLMLLLILAPLLTLSVQAFWQDGWTLQNFLALSERSTSIGFTGAGRAIFNSLRFALLSTSLALALGLCFAFAVVRAGWQWLDQLSLLPLATSSVTLGFAYILVFPKLSSSFWGVLIAHSLIAFPFVVRSLLPALRGLPGTILEAAASLGSSPWAVMRRVELPLLVPSFIAGASFAFTVSMGEFGASLILSRPELATLPVAIFDRLGRPGASNYGSALALSVLLMLITAFAMVMVERFGQSEL